MTPPLFRHVLPLTVRQSLLAVLAVSVLFFIALAPTSQASPLHLRIAQSNSGSHLISKVVGARRAQKVSFFVDGKRRGRDRRWPWTFGRSSRIRIGAGRHKVVAHVRFRKRSLRFRRVVTVTTAQAKRGRALVSIRSQHRNRANDNADVSPRRAVHRPEAYETPPAEEGEEDAAITPGGTTAFRGDFETDNLSEWDLVQRVASDRISLVDDPVHQGRHAARFEVRPGDNIGDTSTRAEVGAYLGEREGEERYYRWYTYFDPNFPTDYPNSFITFTQWRAEDESASYGSFMVWGDQMEFRRDGTRWSTQLTKGVWHKFVYHVKWSPDPNVGFVELWYDNQLVMPKQYVRTMAGSPGAGVSNYIKQGLYKSDDIPTGVLYQDGLVTGTSFAAVNEAS